MTDALHGRRVTVAPAVEHRAGTNDLSGEGWDTACRLIHSGREHRLQVALRNETVWGLVAVWQRGMNWDDAVRPQPGASPENTSVQRNQVRRGCCWRFRDEAGNMGSAEGNSGGFEKVAA